MTTVFLLTFAFFTFTLPQLLPFLQPLTSQQSFQVIIVRVINWNIDFAVCWLLTGAVQKNKTFIFTNRRPVVIGQTLHNFIGFGAVLLTIPAIGTEFI